MQDWQGNPSLPQYRQEACPVLYPMQVRRRVEVTLGQGSSFQTEASWHQPEETCLFPLKGRENCSDMIAMIMSLQGTYWGWGPQVSVPSPVSRKFGEPCRHLCRTPCAFKKFFLKYYHDPLSVLQSQPGSRYPSPQPWVKPQLFLWGLAIEVVQIQEGW